MTTPDTGTRPLRADAERNRLRLIEAASTAFSEHGLDVTVAEITARAGVGKGTFFRHFPTKDSLVVAVVRHRMERVLELGYRMLDHPDPGEALFGYMRGGTELLCCDRALVEVDASSVFTDPQVVHVRDELLDLADRLVRRAQEHGAVRDDVTGVDLVILQGAVGKALAPLATKVPGLWRRYLDIILEGLRPAAACHPLPCGAPSPEALREAFEHYHDAGGSQRHRNR